MKDLVAAVLIVQRRAVDRGHLIAGAQPQAHECHAIAAREYPETGHFAVLGHRLRAHDVADEPGLFGDHVPHALERGVLTCTAAIEGGAALPASLARQNQGLELAVAIDDDPVDVDRMQLRAARKVVADRKHLRGLCGLSEDRQPVLWIIAGDDSGQHQRHARLRRIRRRSPAIRGAAPNRCALVMAATSSACERPARPPGTAAPCVPAPRSVTMSAACTAKATAPGSRWRCAGHRSAAARATAAQPAGPRARRRRSWDGKHGFNGGPSGSCG